MDLSVDDPPDADNQLAAFLREPRLLSSIPSPSIASLADAAERHGVAGLLLARATETAVPLDAAWAALRQRAAAQVVAAQLRDTEALAILEHARQAGLPFTLLKGLALAYTVYPEPWIRARSDTDLLVREQDIPRFDRFFQSFGYSLLPHIRGPLTLPQRHYVRDDGHGFKHAWDLHWRLTSSQALRFAQAEDELRARAQPAVSLEGAYVPSRPDALLLACVHRLAHHFDDLRLIWLWDIRLLLETMTSAELTGFMELTRRPEAAAACARSLSVARDVIGAAIPDELRTLVDHPHKSTAAFLWGGSRRPITYLVGELRAAPAVARVRLLRERALPSLSSMRERYPSVPAVLLPLTYVWRLAWGIPKWMRTR